MLPSKRIPVGTVKAVIVGVVYSDLGNSSYKELLLGERVKKSTKTIPTPTKLSTTVDLWNKEQHLK